MHKPLLLCSSIPIIRYTDTQTKKVMYENHWEYLEAFKIWNYNDYFNPIGNSSGSDGG